MKALLLEHPRGRSKSHFNDIANTPLSSCLISGYLASLLQANGIETEIIDAYLCQYSIEQMEKEIMGKECDVLGVHLVYSWEHTHAVLRTIDEMGSKIGVPIVAYGFYPTFAYDSIMNSHRSIDYAIVGEPELAFFEFCSTIKMVLPASRNVQIVVRISFTINGASPMDGSSSIINDGLAISARPMASICCSPPESVPAS